MKISSMAKAGVPKTLVKQKLRLHSLYFRQNTVSLAGNSVICILFLDFLRFAIAITSTDYVDMSTYSREAALFCPY